MIEALMAGLLLGLAAGVAPGPMLALTVSQSLRYGLREGLRVAAAPLLSDLPIIAVTLAVLISFAQTRTVLGVIALLGGVYVGFLAWETWRSSPADMQPSKAGAGSLRKAVLTNFLNPHPYLFWVAAGGPFVLGALHASGVWAAAGFIAAFYVMLIGAKAVLALLVGHYRGLLRGRAYAYTLRVLALGLAVLALVLLSDGVRLLGY
ncbi:MAG: LysE family transporter [Acidihalobacter sp.]|uniref:LysE family translocator n=1 Tax=Acidihalobacter sp. TaxID=1872108 RepID=UPI00307DEA70